MSTWQQRKTTSDVFFCISVEWFNNAVFVKEIAVGLGLWPRPQNWFRVLLANREMDPLWKMHFRVTRPTFDALCDLLRGDLQKQHTRMRSPVSVEVRVGVGLWRLATGDSKKKYTYI